MDSSTITRIKKRGEEIVLFNKEKITNAIFKAAVAAGGHDKERSEELANRVVAILEYQYDENEIPSVEKIQDIIERVLIKSGCAKTAKLFILYREKRRQTREAKTTMVHVSDTISAYLGKTDWKVNENSNEDYSFSGLLLYTAGTVIKNYALNQVYPKKVADAHKQGYIHIHDLSHGFIGYCCGHSIKNLLTLGFGGVPNKANASAAKHLNVVVHQMVNYIGCLQMEFAGAQAFSSIDTYLAPFIKTDNLTQKQVKQSMQELVYSLNVPSRWGCFSEDTEILTKDGWKPGKNLKVGETIATFNIDNEKIEYLPVKRMTIDNYKGKMFNLKNRIMDQLITPNHRVLRRIDNFKENKSQTKYVFERADKLKTNTPLIPLGKRKHSQITSINKVDYNGIVWCPTTENNTVIVRRNGKVFISGNSQYPFSNLTFDWVVPDDLKNEPAIVGGKPQDFTYGDCQKEMDMLNKAFLEVMTEGDSSERVFTFPIPTYNITKDFNWDSENAKSLFALTSKYGLPYFQNYVGSNLDPKSIRAMCCRLNLDLNELMNRPGGMWSMGDSTGSLGVVTMNVAIMAYESKNKQEFFKKIKDYMTLGKESLEIKRKIVTKNLENGLMPYTKRYLGHFNNHFSTIGLVGMNEACLNLIDEEINTEKGKQLAIDTLNFMRKIMTEFQKETENLYNLEATPAEGCSYRLALLSRKKYSDMILSGTDEPFLTNSTQLNVNHTDDMITALEHQNDIQPLYSGGTIFNTFIGEQLSSGESTKQLVKKISDNTRLPYFSITPTFSACLDHGYLKGEVESCPECGKECEIYSRIVGYFRPTRNWNKGKKEEYKNRVEYLEDKGLKNEFTRKLTIAPKQQTLKKPIAQIATNITPQKPAITP